MKQPYFESNSFTRALTAAIPHMAPQYRRTLHMAVKISELAQAHDFYAEKEANSETQAVQKQSWRQDMLRAMQPCFSTEQQKTLDILATCFEAQAMMKDFLQFKEDFEI